MNLAMPLNRFLPTALLYASIIASGPLAAQQPAANDALRELTEQIRLLRHEMSALRKELKASGQRVAPSATASAAAAAPISVELLAGDRAMGAANARVAIVEYSDFECPFCNRFHQQSLPRLKAEYIDTGKVRYVFRAFPLSFHKNAKAAHVAAHCAGEQDKFWEMQHALFLNQKRLGAELFDEKMASLSLDATRFAECLRDPASVQAIDVAMRTGEVLNVRGTPTFFIGRMRDGILTDAVRVSGAQPFSRFAGHIERLLR